MVESRPYTPRKIMSKRTKDHEFEDLELYWDYKQQCSLIDNSTLDIVSESETGAILIEENIIE
jgi:hypothetical protein